MRFAETAERGAGATTAGRMGAAQLAPYVAAAAVLAAETITHLVDFAEYDLRIRILDSSAEWSYSHLLGTLAFAVGAICGLVGVRSAARHRGAWWTICLVFSFLLLDNVSRLHEHIPAWPVFYAPLLMALCGSLIIVAAGTDLATVTYAGVGLLFASLAIHVLGPPAVRLLGWGVDSWAYQIKVALKEGSELAGWVLLVPALARLARRLRPGARLAVRRSARGAAVS